MGHLARMQTLPIPSTQKERDLKVPKGFSLESYKLESLASRFFYLANDRSDRRTSFKAFKINIAQYYLCCLVLRGRLGNGHGVILPLSCFLINKIGLAISAEILWSD